MPPVGQQAIATRNLKKSSIGSEVSSSETRKIETIVNTDTNKIESRPTITYVVNEPKSEVKNKKSKKSKTSTKLIGGKIIKTQSSTSILTDDGEPSVQIVELAPDDDLSVSSSLSEGKYETRESYSSTQESGSSQVASQSSAQLISDTISKDVNKKSEAVKMIGGKIRKFFSGEKSDTKDISKGEDNGKIVVSKNISNVLSTDQTIAKSESRSSFKETKASSVSSKKISGTKVIKTSTTTIIGPDGKEVTTVTVSDPEITQSVTSSEKNSIYESEGEIIQINDGNKTDLKMSSTASTYKDKIVSKDGQTKADVTAAFISNESKSTLAGIENTSQKVEMRASNTSDGVNSSEITSSRTSNVIENNQDSFGSQAVVNVKLMGGKLVKMFGKGGEPKSKSKNKTAQKSIDSGNKLSFSETLVEDQVTSSGTTSHSLKEVSSAENLKNLSTYSSSHVSDVNISNEFKIENDTSSVSQKNVKTKIDLHDYDDKKTKQQTAIKSTEKITNLADEKDTHQNTENVFSMKSQTSTSVDKSNSDIQTNKQVGGKLIASDIEGKTDSTINSSFVGTNLRSESQTSMTSEVYSSTQENKSQSSSSTSQMTSFVKDDSRTDKKGTRIVSGKLIVSEDDLKYDLGKHNIISTNDMTSSSKEIDSQKDKKESQNIHINKENVLVNSSNSDSNTYTASSSKGTRIVAGKLVKSKDDYIMEKKGQNKKDIKTVDGKIKTEEQDSASDSATVSKSTHISSQTNTLNTSEHFMNSIQAETSKENIFETKIVNQKDSGVKDILVREILNDLPENKKKTSSTYSSSTINKKNDISDKIINDKTIESIVIGETEDRITGKIVPGPAKTSVLRTDSEKIAISKINSENAASFSSDSFTEETQYASTTLIKSSSSTNIKGISAYNRYDERPIKPAKNIEEILSSETIQKNDASEGQTVKIIAGKIVRHGKMTSPTRKSKNKESVSDVITSKNSDLMNKNITNVSESESISRSSSFKSEKTFIKESTIHETVMTSDGRVISTTMSSSEPEKPSSVRMISGKIISDKTSQKQNTSSNQLVVNEQYAEEISNLKSDIQEITNKLNASPKSRRSSKSRSSVSPDKKSNKFLTDKNIVEKNDVSTIDSFSNEERLLSSTSYTDTFVSSSNLKNTFVSDDVVEYHQPVCTCPPEEHFNSYDLTDNIMSQTFVVDESHSLFERGDKTSRGVANIRGETDITRQILSNTSMLDNNFSNKYDSTQKTKNFVGDKSYIDQDISRTLVRQNTFEKTRPSQEVTEHKTDIKDSRDFSSSSISENTLVTSTTTNIRMIGGKIIKEDVTVTKRKSPSPDRKQQIKKIEKSPTPTRRTDKSPVNKVDRSPSTERKQPKSGKSPDKSLLPVDKISHDKKPDRGVRMVGGKIIKSDNYVSSSDHVSNTFNSESIILENTVIQSNVNIVHSSSSQNINIVDIQDVKDITDRKVVKDDRKSIITEQYNQNISVKETTALVDKKLTEKTTRKSKDRKDKKTEKTETVIKEQCICEICTCG